MSISNLRFDEGIKSINSNLQKSLDTLIMEKSTELSNGQVDISSSVKNYSYKMIDTAKGVTYEPILGFSKISENLVASTVNIVIDIACSDETNFCIYSNNTILCYDAIELYGKTKGIAGYNVSKMNIKNNILCACILSDNRVYVIKKSDTGDLTKLGDLIDVSSVRDAYLSDDGFIYCIGYRIMKKYNSTTLELVTSLSISNQPSSNCQFFDWNGDLYVATGNTIYSVNRETLTLTLYFSNPSVTIGDQNICIKGNYLFMRTGANSTNYAITIIDMNSKNVVYSHSLVGYGFNKIHLGISGDSLYVSCKISGGGYGRMLIFNTNSPYNLIGKFTVPDASSYFSSNNGIVYSAKEKSLYAFSLAQKGIKCIE